MSCRVAAAAAVGRTARPPSGRGLSGLHMEEEVLCPCSCLRWSLSWSIQLSQIGRAFSGSIAMQQLRCASPWTTTSLEAHLLQRLNNWSMPATSPHFVVRSSSRQRTRWTSYGGNSLPIVRLDRPGLAPAPPYTRHVAKNGFVKVAERQFDNTTDVMLKWMRRSASSTRATRKA